MSLLKIITILNWLVIGFLAIVVLLETLSPNKGGGDAAGRGVGQVLYYLAIIATVVLTFFNLLPYNWAKYTAFALILTPFIWAKVSPLWQDMQKRAKYAIEDAKPVFEEKELDRVAKAVRDGKLDDVKKMLEAAPQLAQNGELFAYTISEANHTSYRPEEKMECVRLFFQHGARLDSANLATGDVPVHMAVAEVGNAALLRLLLEKGADANAEQVNFKRAIIFEAIGAYKEPEETVRVLLDFGADPNATAVFDDEQGPVSPLLRAAELGRWGICTALLEKGADRGFKPKDGRSFEDYVREADADFAPDGYSTWEDFDRLKKYLAGR